MTIEQIENFRQLGSKTPGHPENFITSGVETTTGPLGQGVAFSVGSALAERLLAAEFGEDIVDHYTYVLCSDGDLMEGVSHEALALAGHLKLNKLIFLYDDNGITIDGPINADRQCRPGGALQGAWLERGADRRPGPEGDRRGDHGGAVLRSSLADRLQDHDRLRRAAQGRHLEGPWRAARRRRTRRRQEGAGLELRSVRDSRRRAGGLAQCRQAGRQRPRRLAQPLRGQAGSRAQRIHAPGDRAQAPDSARRGDPQAQGKTRRRAADGRHPQGQRNGARGAGADRCRNCCSARPT